MTIHDYLASCYDKDNNTYHITLSKILEINPDVQYDRHSNDKLNLRWKENGINYNISAPYHELQHFNKLSNYVSFLLSENQANLEKSIYDTDIYNKPIIEHIKNKAKQYNIVPTIKWKVLRNFLWPV